MSTDLSRLSSSELLALAYRARQREDEERQNSQRPVLEDRDDIIWGISTYEMGETFAPTRFFRRAADAIVEAEVKVREMSRSDGVVWNGKTCKVPGHRAYAEIFAYELR